MPNFESKVSFYTKLEKGAHTLGSAAIGAGVALAGQKVAQLSALSLNIATAAGFAAGVKVIAAFATPHVNTFITNNYYFNAAISHTVGGLACYGATYGLASLGYIAVAITAPQAAALVAAVLVLALLRPDNAEVIVDKKTKFLGTVTVKEAKTKEFEYVTGTLYKDKGLKEDQIVKGETVSGKEFDADGLVIREAKRRYDKDGKPTTYFDSTAYVYDDKKVVKKTIHTATSDLVFTYEADGKVTRVGGETTVNDIKRAGNSFDEAGKLLLDGTKTDTKSGAVWEGTFEAKTEKFLDGRHTYTVTREGAPDKVVVDDYKAGVKQ